MEDIKLEIVSDYDVNNDNHYNCPECSSIIEIKSIVIHPLNIINQNYLFQIDNSSDYYFYTSLINVKENEKSKFIKLYS